MNPDARRVEALSSRVPAARTPRVMGIVNVTPDSFTDGGRFERVDAALARAVQLVDEGADIIDVGGESTRPGACGVDVDTEVARVVPLIGALKGAVSTLVSVDTSSPEVMRRAVEAGAGMLNDVRALRAPGALDAAADLGVDVCLVHMQGEPATMNRAPRYRNVVLEVRDFLLERVAACRDAGIADERLWIDPGLGFGKTQAQGLRLIAELQTLIDTGYPVLVGASRKFGGGEFARRDALRRVGTSVALAMEATRRGAAMLRVHDVAETVDALRALELVGCARADADHHLTSPPASVG